MNSPPSIHKAADVLRQLVAADSGAIKHLLNASTQYPPTAEIPKLKLERGAFLTGAVFLNTMLEAAGVGSLEIENLDKPPEQIKVTALEPVPRLEYRAIPLLVYVPKSADETADEQRVLDLLRSDLEIRAFLAEDFNNGDVTLDEDEDPSAFISTVCPHAPGT